MDVPSIGSLALGIFMGYLAWYFIKRLDSYTTGGLTAVVGILVGGVVVTFLDWTPPAAATGASGPTPAGDLIHRWWYPIGLVVGFLIWYVAEWIRIKSPPSLNL
jgi:hypothetical protein